LVTAGWRRALGSATAMRMRLMLLIELSTRFEVDVLDAIATSATP
jgi:hypothetical protein